MSIICTDDDNVALMDNTGGYPLPIKTFPNEEQAKHFLGWATEEVGEDIRGIGFMALESLRKEWAAACLDESGDLTEAAIRSTTL